MCGKEAKILMNDTFFSSKNSKDAGLKKKNRCCMTTKDGTAVICRVSVKVLYLLV